MERRKGPAGALGFRQNSENRKNRMKERRRQRKGRSRGKEGG